MTFSNLSHKFVPPQIWRWPWQFWT